MSDNDGYNVVASAIRRQMMVKGPLPSLKALMIRDGLSVSEAIRKYTSLYGLPPDCKELQALNKSLERRSNEEGQKA